MASFASMLVPGVNIPQTDFSWISGAADSINGAIDRSKQNKSFNRLADLIGQPQNGAVQPGAIAPGVGQQQPQQQPMTAPVMGVDRSAPQGDVYKPFIETVKTKITNPYGLAAVAATGRAESRYSPENVNRTWSDPSESGQAGTSGGILSWRGPRLANLQAYAASKGEQGNGSPQTQGEFLLQENPQLIAQLNTARSPDEAAGMMANAWKFAGHDRQGGEAARRQALAQNYYAQEFANQPAGAAAAIDAQAPGGMGSPMTDQAFDGRFGETALPGQVAQGMSGLATALTEGNRTGAVPQDPASTANAMATPQPASYAPNQVADASGQPFAGAPAVQPIPRGGVPVELLQTMLRDPNLREMGLKLWAQNVQGPNNAEPWQFVQGPDGTLLRANQQTGQIEPIGNFAKPASTEEPKIVELFDEATGQPYKAQWNAKTGGYERIGGIKARSGMQLTTNPDGTVTLTEGVANNMPKLTESEGRNSGFYGRGVESQKTLNDLESEGKSLWNKTAGSIPVVGNYALTEDGQKYDQARRNFINAVLRRESGAVISPEEFANAEKQYFPQPGDGKDVIAQKRLNRDTTIQGLKISSGQGAKYALPQGQEPQNGAAPMRATNPQTGEVLELQNGQWVPVQ